MAHLNTSSCPENIFMWNWILNKVCTTHYVKEGTKLTFTLSNNVLYVKIFLCVWLSFENIQHSKITNNYNRIFAAL